MQPDFPEPLATPSNQSSSELQPLLSVKPPRPLLDDIFAFPPNRDTLGGTAYFIVENLGNILVDCPAWNEANQQFLAQHGGVRWLVVTHRGGIGKVREISLALNCDILIQEQEAYLLPQLNVTTFHREFTLSPHTSVIWTPGHSPGAACIYHDKAGGVLFTGRHLLPNPQGELVPLRTPKTFHYPRQLASVELLRSRFTPDTLHYICPGANTGFLRGKGAIDQAYQHLSQIVQNS